jgi:hypothetical protein
VDINISIRINVNGQIFNSDSIREWPLSEAQCYGRIQGTLLIGRTHVITMVAASLGSFHESESLSKLISVPIRLGRLSIPTNITEIQDVAIYLNPAAERVEDNEDTEEEMVNKIAEAYSREDPLLVELAEIEEEIPEEPVKLAGATLPA